MSESSKEAIASYFTDLLTDASVSEATRTDVAPERPSHSPATTAAPATTSAPAKSTVKSPAEPQISERQRFTSSAETEFDETLKSLEATKKQQLQALFNNQIVVAEPVPPTNNVTEVSAQSTAYVAASAPETDIRQSVAAKPHVNNPQSVNPSTHDTAVMGIRSEYLAWADNGRPVWAKDRFDVLLFQVAGLTLAVPLIALGQIYPITEDLAPVFGQVDWFMGFQPTSAGAVRTINTALFVMPERYDKNFVNTAKYVISIDGVDWGLAVDAVRNPSSLLPEEVTWRSQRSKRPWLAGTVKSAMCALIDIPQMAYLLQQHDRKRRSVPD